MGQYTPPIEDMVFTLRQVVGLTDPAEDDLRLILESAGQLASGALAPLNHSGDREGSHLIDGKVVTPKGFREAYAQYRDGGWNGVPFSPHFGGQGLPWALAFAVQEMWQSANMSFGLCPLLNQAAVEAIEVHGSPEQQKAYLAKLISGEWTGTMNLTEPDSGSDLSTLKTKAVKQQDGSYRITGQKIFITYGDHDLADNIIHMVLARTPDAPEGVKGISLFLVPKFIPDAAGKPGQRNDVRCVSLEHKMGIHASPTCVMQYGEAGGATGWLIGRENEGLKYMFTMMNNARLSVGLQGVALAERATQHALDYARQRIQGTRLGDKGGKRVPIIEHPDVRRMLLSMKTQVQAGRMLAYEAAFAMDKARQGDQAAQDKVDLITPVVKAWCTDMAVDVASTGIQIHGGMGFIEETGAAQYYRDARILPIYEGTNGLQAIDMSFRKIISGKGTAMVAWIAEARASLSKCTPELQPMRAPLAMALDRLEKATQLILSEPNMEAVASVNVPYLRAFGTIAGGVVHLRAAATAKSKPAGALFYGTHILPRSYGDLETVMMGSASVCAVAANDL